MEMTVVHTLHPDVLKLLQGIVGGKGTSEKAAAAKPSKPAAKDDDQDDDQYDETTVTIEQIREVLAQKKDQGKTVKIRALLEKYGVKSATNLAIADYADFIAKARKL